MEIREGEYWDFLTEPLIQKGIVAVLAEELTNAVLRARTDIAVRPTKEQIAWALQQAAVRINAEFGEGKVSEGDLMLFVWHAEKVRGMAYKQKLMTIQINPNDIAGIPHIDLKTATFESLGLNHYFGEDEIIRARDSIRVKKAGG